MTSTTSSTSFSTSPGVVFLSLEFLPPLFSGNGTYSRSIVRALKHQGLRVLVVSGASPVSAAASTSSSSTSSSSSSTSSFSLTSLDGIPIVADEETREASLSPHGVIGIPLPSWGRLDRRSAWSSFSSSISSPLVMQAIHSFNPSAVALVDWTGAQAWKSLASACNMEEMGELRALASLPSVYLNFRVFSTSTDLHSSSASSLSSPSPATTTSTAKDSTSSPTPSSPQEPDLAFYMRVEAEAVRSSTSSVALCRLDALHLAALACGADPNKQEKEQEGEVMPSSDATAEQQRDGSYKTAIDSDQGAPSSHLSAAAVAPLSEPGGAAAAGAAPEATSPCCLSNWAATDIRVVLPPLRSDMQALAATASSASSSSWPGSLSSARPTDGWRTLTSVVRLSPEKGPHRFADLCAALENVDPGIFARCKLHPLLCGSAPDPSYAASVRAGVREVGTRGGVEPLILTSFLGPLEMAAIYSRTALNVHSSLADAYGMTVVEAAAFGAPSLVHVPEEKAGGGNAGGGGSSAGDAASLFEQMEIVRGATAAGEAGANAVGALRLVLPRLSAFSSEAAAAAAGRALVSLSRSLPPIGACDLLGEAGDPRAVGSAVLAVDLTLPASEVAAKVVAWFSSQVEVEGGKGEGVGHGQGRSANAPTTTGVLAKVAAAARQRALGWTEEDNGAALAAVLKEAMGKR